jgi:hypothetical protein
VTPAETPTEVCVECQRLTVTGHGTFPYAGGHTLALHARIRELVGIIRKVDAWNYGSSSEEAPFPHDEIKAALARSEGGGA